MSVVSQRFSRTSNAGGAPTRENNVVSLGGTIGARGLPPGPDLRPYKSLTCSDAMRTGPNGRHRGLLRLTECSHHVGSSGVGVCGWLDLDAKLRTGAWLLEYGIVTIRLAGVV